MNEQSIKWVDVLINAGEHAEIFGTCTHNYFLSVLEDLQQQLTDDFADEKQTCEYRLINFVWIEGERQYNGAEVYVIPGYWEYEIAEKRIIPVEEFTDNENDNGSLPF